MRALLAGVLLLLLVAAVHSTACGSYIIRCGTIGQNCTAGATDGLAIAVNPAVCPDGAGDISSPPSCVTCEAGLYCHADSYCAAIPGRACTSTPQCQSYIPTTTMTPQICSGGFCIDDPNDIFAHGDSCTTTAQCIGVLTCNVNGTCTNPGSSCTTSEECDTTDFCSSGSCVARKALAGSCVVNPEEECLVGLVCQDGTCHNTFAGGVGEGCSDSLAQKIGCLDGFQCQQNPVNDTFVCDIHPNVVGSGCVANLAGECSTTKGGKCLCSLASGVGECFADVPRAICSSEWSVFMDCMASNECHFDHTLSKFYAGTCARDFCTTSYASLVSCIDQPRAYVSNNCGTVDAAREVAGLPPRGTSDVIPSAAATLALGYWGLVF